MPLFTTLFLKTWIATVAIFITLDMLWLGLVANRFYFHQLNYLAKVSGDSIVFNLPIGILAQIIIATGLAVILTLTQPQNLTQSLLIGAFLGFVIYATYDLTNLSFVKNWPLTVTLVDIAWGTTQGALAGIYIYYLTHAF